MSILSNLLVEAKGSRLTISATDLGLSIHVCLKINATPSLFR
jgi:DNA polymerase III sliding clamp (beta) subunit (PCNA family)